MMRIGLFAGSFDPFTIGHMSIVRRALPLFDRLIIGIGVNEHKQCMTPPLERKKTIERLFEGVEGVEVMTYSGLTADFARSLGAHYVVKGVRSVADFECERTQADINRMIGDVETILLTAEPGLDCVSSTVARELAHFGKDISALLPKPCNDNNDNKTIQP